MGVFFGDEPARGVVGVDETSIQRPKAGFFDNIGIGFESGIKETSLSLLKDLALSSKAKKSLDDRIAEQDWNPTHPYWVEDIDWREDLTNDVARNIWEERGFESELAAITARSTTKGTVGRFVGGFGGAMFDPINLVPIGYGVTASKGLWNAVKVGATTNMILEGSIYTPLALATQNVRGRDVTAGNIAQNLVFATAIGGILPGAAMGFKNLFKHISAGKVPTDKNIIDQMDNIKDNTPESQLVAELVTIGQGTPRSQKFSKFDSDYLPNIKMNTIVDTLTVDARGVKQSVDYAGDDAVQIIPGQNLITLSGNIKSITKILPTIKNNLEGIENIQIQLNGNIINVKDIDVAITSLAKKHGVKAELDDAVKVKVRTRLDDTEYDIEVDPETNQIKAVFETTMQKKGDPTGAKQKVKGRKLTNEEANPIVTKILDNIKEKQKRAPNTVTRENSPENQIQNETGIDAENTQVKNFEQSTTAENTQTAHDMMVGEAFATLSRQPGNKVQSLIAHSAFNDRTWADAGYVVVTAEDGVKTLRSTGEPTTETGKKIREIIKKALNDDVENVKQLEAKKKVIGCLITNGLI